MIVVGGPRIDPGSLAHGDGVETLGYVHRLHRHLAACDLAICHGGLSTTMELTAAGRPFLYFPLRRHFEQNHHVAHRLAPLRRRPADELRRRDGPAEIAAAMAEEIGREPRYRPVDGRRRGARGAQRSASCSRPARASRSRAS